MKKIKKKKTKIKSKSSLARAKKPKTKKVKLIKSKATNPVKKKKPPVRTIKKKKRPAQTVRTRTKQIETKPQRLAVVDSKRIAVPLVVEPYPKDYTGLPFLTLIQFRKQPMLVIVDNVDEELIKAYVLDLCGPERVDEEKVILAASEWYEKNKSDFPVSIEFSRRGMTTETSRIYRTFDVEFVSRVIGPAPEFPMSAVTSVKRRRRKSVPQGVEINISGATPLDPFLAL